MDISLLVAAVMGSNVIFQDSLNRPDNNTTLGSPDIGSPWIAVTGTWGTIGNEGYSVSDVDGQIVRSTVSAANYTVNCSIKGDIANGTNSRRPTIIFRYVDTNNYWFISTVAGNLGLRKIDAGTLTSPANAAMTTVSDTWYRIKIVCNDSNIKAYVDDVLKVDYTMDGPETTKFSTANGIGIRYSKSGTPVTPARFDDYVVTA